MKRPRRTPGAPPSGRDVAGRRRRHGAVSGQANRHVLAGGGQTGRARQLPGDFRQCPVRLRDAQGGTARGSAGALCPIRQESVLRHLRQPPRGGSGRPPPAQRHLPGGRAGRRGPSGRQPCLLFSANRSWRTTPGVSARCCWPIPSSWPNKQTGDSGTHRKQPVPGPRRKPWPGTGCLVGCGAAQRSGSQSRIEGMSAQRSGSVSYCCRTQAMAASSPA